MQTETNAEKEEIKALHQEVRDLRLIIVRLDDELVALQKALLEFKRKYEHGNFDF